MKKIYPKVCKNFEGIEKIEKYIDSYKGIEIQFFNQKGITNEFDFKDTIIELLEKYPMLDEVTIHPPLNNYALEEVMARDKKIIINQLVKCTELANELKIRINFLYHTNWNIHLHLALTKDLFDEMLATINGHNVRILIENTVFIDESTCTALDLCSYYDNEQLKACIDICHLYCKANMFDTNIKQFLKRYLNKDQARKYVYQVHFSNARKNDGYRDITTHARSHSSVYEVARDLEILREYGIDEVNYIAEINEENYLERTDQIKEIKFLEKCIIKGKN